jgi:hypothetical protein
MLRHPCGVYLGFRRLLAVCVGLAALPVEATERSAAYAVSLSELAPAGTVVAELSSVIGSGDWTQASTLNSGRNIY